MNQGVFLKTLIAVDTKLIVNDFHFQQHRYKSDLNFMKGVGWMVLRSPQIESVKKAGELISEVTDKSFMG